MKWTTIVMIVIILNLPILITLTSTRFLIFNENNYHNLFAKNNVYKEMPYADEILHNITTYFRYEKTLQLDIFTENEKRHMRDVKLLINKLLILYYILLIVDGVLIWILIRGKKKKIISTAVLISGSLVILFSLLLYFLRNSFTALFVQFHLIFFPHGNWMFYSSSNLIRLFPESFFYDFLYDIMKNSVFMSTILIICGILCFVLTREKKRI